MPIVLQIDYDEKRDVFDVVLVKDQVAHKEEMTPLRYRQLCQDLDRGFKVGDLAISFAHRHYPGIPVRTKRSLVAAFRARLRQYEVQLGQRRAISGRDYLP